MQTKLNLLNPYYGQITLKYIYFVRINWTKNFANGNFVVSFAYRPAINELIDQCLLRVIDWSTQSGDNRHL